MLTKAAGNNNFWAHLRSIQLFRHITITLQKINKNKNYNFSLEFSDDRSSRSLSKLFLATRCQILHVFLKGPKLLSFLRHEMGAENWNQFTVNHCHYINNSTRQDMRGQAERVTTIPPACIHASYQNLMYPTLL